MIRIIQEQGWRKASVLLVIIVMFPLMNSSEKAVAASYSENFGGSCYSLSSGLSVRYNGGEVPNSLTDTSAHYQAYTNALMSGCALRLNAISSNLIITFPLASQPVSLSFATYAVNGNQSVVVTYTDSTTTSFIVPDSIGYAGYLNTVSFTGSGKRIALLTFTPANNPDIYVLDNLVWSAPSDLNLGKPTLATAPVKGQFVTASVSSDNPGKATFYVDSKRIAGCLAVPSTGTSPNYTASCTFKPAVSGSHRLQVLFTPTDVGISAVRNESNITVSRRSNKR